MEQIKKFVGFETVFTLFLFSYQFKNTAFFLTLPDITTILAFLIIASGGFLFFKNKLYQKSQGKGIFFSVLALVTWACISTTWSPDVSYPSSKALVLSIFTFPAFVVAFFIVAYDMDRLKRFSWNVIAIGVLTLGEIIRVYLTRSYIGGLDFIWGTNYLVTGQTLGITFLLVLFYADTFHAKSPRFAWAGILLAGLLGFALWHIGGRGPLLATIAGSLSLLLVAFFKKEQGRFLRSFVSTLVVTTLAHFGLGLFAKVSESSTLARLSSFYTVDSTATFDDSTLERFEYLTSGITAFGDHPLIGVGLGGWPFYHGLGEKFLHPHNLFVEVAAELGLIGLVFVFVTVYFLGARIFSAFKEKEFSSTFTVLLSLCVFTGFNAMKSGDLNDNILLFVVVGLLANYQVAQGFKQ